MKERRNGIDRRASNVIHLVTDQQVKFVQQAGQTFIDSAQQRGIHSVFIVAMGHQNQCDIYFAGHAQRYADAMVGRLLRKFPGALSS